MSSIIMPLRDSRRVGLATGSSPSGGNFYSWRGHKTDPTRFLIRRKEMDRNASRGAADTERIVTHPRRNNSFLAEATNDCQALKNRLVRHLCYPIEIE